MPGGRHAVSDRYLTVPARTRAQDIAELEAAVSQNLLPADALGAPHRLLRAFRSLLFLDTPALAAQPAVAAALPPSVLVHHLYSRAPPALVSPHTRSGYSPAQVRARAPSEPPHPSPHHLALPWRCCTALHALTLLGACAASQYSLWLDQHSMAEALRFIRTALEAFAPAAREEAGFGDVYPIMLDLCCSEKMPS